MKSRIISILIAVSTVLLVGCEDNNDVVVADFTPAAPQGVYSITGDNAVYLFWNGPYESDIDGYIVWRSLEPITNYQEIGYVDAVPNPDLDLLIYEYVDASAVNGVTYYYAVSSVDNAGQVSELSAENVFDTPRPDGFVELFDFLVEPTLAGFSLSARAVLAYDSPAADIYIDRVGNIFYINASDELTDLQDMGYTNDFDEIGWAPADGWSENGWMEIILNHCYVIWTRDNHFAKMRVLSIHSNSISFEWAFQTVEGLQELKPVVMEKPVHDADYLIKDF